MFVNKDAATPVPHIDIKLYAKKSDTSESRIYIPALAGTASTLFPK